MISNLTYFRSRVRPSASIQTKLALAFLVLLAVILTLGLLGMQQIRTVSESSQRFETTALPRVVLRSDVERALTAHSLLAKRRVQTTDFRQVATITRAMRTAESDFSSGLDRLEQHFANPDERQIFDHLRVEWDAYLGSIAEVIELSDQGALRRAQLRFDEKTQALIDDISSDLSELAEFSRLETQNISDLANQRYARARLMTIIALCVSVAAVLTTRRWISSEVSKPLLSISTSMERLILGNDDVTLPDLGHRTDEIGTLARAAESFRDSLLASRDLARDVERERKRLMATVTNMPIGLAIFDTAGKLILSNTALHDVFRFPAATLEDGLSESALLHLLSEIRGLTGSDAETFRSRILDVKSQNQRLNEIWSLADGRSVEIIVHATADGWMIISEDVTDRVMIEQNTRRAARQDALTGLANRLAFQEHIESALKTPDRDLAVLLIDLDRFKHINDTLGHPAGDELLRQVAERIEWIVDDTMLVARLGGDEFAIVGTPRDGAQAMDVGRQVVEQLATRYDIEGHGVQVGGSVGVALAPAHGTTAEELMRNADLALYEAKALGRGNCQLYDPTLGQRQIALHELEQDLRRAIQADEFILHYQPLVDVRSGRIWGAEALLRWNHPTRGLLAPDKFIGLAEELGLIVPIGQMVLDKACAAAAHWPDHIKVSVNLSPRQLLSRDIVTDLKRALRESGVAPARLELEVTENVLIKDTEQARIALQGLRSAGVSIAIDDFGTGYSSLQYLQSFPFTRMKIDRSFVGGLPDDPGAVAIVDAICSLGASFGIEVTAEGIETDAQLAFIASAGVSVGQGYLFSRPVEETQFTFLLDQETSERRLVGA